MELIEMLHPGYKPPTEQDIADCLLDEVFDNEMVKCSVLKR